MRLLCAGLWVEVSRVLSSARRASARKRRAEAVPISIGELVRRDERDLLTFRNFGRKSLDELGKIVDSLGLSFGMDVDRYMEPAATA